MSTIYTIGHSSLHIADFIDMLTSFGIHTLADVRSMPGSRRHPQFNASAFSRSLAEAGIAYVHIPALGGKQRNPADSTVPFAGYTAYMTTPTFAQGIHQLLTLAEKDNTVYMCAEADWRNCHRSKISNHIHHLGWTVLHINGINSCEQHTLPPTLPVQGNLFL